MCLLFDHLGNCHNLALALHQKTSLPFCILYGERKDGEKTEYVLIHMGILFNDEFFDELGNQGFPHELLEEFISANQPYENTQIYVIRSTQDKLFNEILDKTCAVIDSTKVSYYLAWIDEKKELYPFL